MGIHSVEIRGIAAAHHLFHPPIMTASLTWEFVRYDGGGRPRLGESLAATSHVIRCLFQRKYEAV